MSRVCHRCGHDIGALERVGRRDTCLGCGSDLHCCRNCAFYDVAYHNQCREPQAERQVDKERGNFCEYFSVAETKAGGLAAQAARTALDGLFSPGGRRAVGAAATGAGCGEHRTDGAAPSRVGRKPG